MTFLTIFNVRYWPKADTRPLINGVMYKGNKATMTKKSDSKVHLNHLGIGVGLGIVFGLTLGTAFGNVGVGISIGISVGAAVGLLLGQKAKTKRSQKMNED